MYVEITRLPEQPYNFIDMNIDIMYIQSDYL